MTTQQQLTNRQRLIKCLEERLKREFFNQRRLNDTLAGYNQQSQYVVIDGGDAEGRVNFGSNYQT